MITIKRAYSNIWATCIQKIGEKLWEWDWISVNEERIKTWARPIQKQKEYDTGWIDFNAPWWLWLKEEFTYPKLDEKWLLSYIEVMSSIYNNKTTSDINYSDQVDWIEWSILVEINWSYSPKKPEFKHSKNEYSISFWIQNKYRIQWRWVDYIKNYFLKVEWSVDFYDPKRHWTDDSYSYIYLTILPENLEQYINDLIEEYEKETGKKYMRRKKSMLNKLIRR